MTKVFIGGSRRMTKLAPSILGRIDNIINSNFTVLIGDANGTDKGIQEYLANKHYENVVVFCTGDVCRNNIGNWETRNVVADSGKKGFDFYAVKDQQMAKEASYGFMIWDAKSKGTLNNIINLLKGKKQVLVYFSPDKSFYALRNAHELSDLLAKCDKEALEEFDKKLAIAEFLDKEQSELEFA